MFQTITQLTKWSLIPLLVVASMFSYFAARYEPLVDGVVCLGAIVLIQRAVWSKEFLWAGALVGIVVVFSPLALTGKVFFLMGITCLESCVSLFRALRPQAVEAL